MVKIVFIGTSEFASVILNKLSKTQYKPLLVITNPDKPSGRSQKITPPPVKIIAEENNIEVYQPSKIKESEQKIKELKPDLGITVAYGQKLPLEVLNIPKYGLINVHPSLLPLYRGPSPIREAILNNDKETGVTIMLMNEKLDEGPIISQEKHLIKDKINYSELSLELSEKGVDLLIETIPQWISGKINHKNQENHLGNYTKIMSKKDGKIDWNLSATEIERRVRALNPWPGTYSFYKDKGTGQKKIVKILEADIQFQTENGPFGPLGKVYMATNNRLAVQTGKDFLIIKKIQIENKKPTEIEEFINGNISFIGTIFK